MDWIALLFLMFGVAAFAVQVAISDLSEKVKFLLGLQQPYKFNAILSIKFWRKFLGDNVSMVLSPFILIIILLGNVHKFISELVSCPYCIVMYLMFGVNVLFLGMPIIDSIIYAPLGLVGVTILDKIMTR